MRNKTWSEQAGATLLQSFGEAESSLNPPSAQANVRQPIEKKSQSKFG
jgi:hypothetical protein